MRQIAIAVAMAGWLGACAAAGQGKPGDATPVTLTDVQTKQFQEGARRDLKDPDSARFGPMAAARAPDGTVYICGWVNAKNSFGGYTGMRPYLGKLDGATARIGMIANDSIEASFITGACLARGVQVPAA